MNGLNFGILLMDASIFVGKESGFNNLFAHNYFGNVAFTTGCCLLQLLVADGSQFGWLSMMLRLLMIAYFMKHSTISPSERICHISKDAFFLASGRVRDSTFALPNASLCILIYFVAMIAVITRILWNEWSLSMIVKNSLGFAIAILWLDLSFDVGPVKQMFLYYVRVFVEFSNPFVPFSLILSAIGCVYLFAASGNWMLLSWPISFVVGFLCLQFVRNFIDAHQPLPMDAKNRYRADDISWSWRVLAIHVLFFSSLVVSFQAI